MRALLTVLLLSLSLAGMAQIPLGDIYRPEGGDDGRLPDNWVFELTYSMWLDAPDAVKPQVGWPGVNAYWMNDIRFGNSPMSFAFGVGIGSDQYHTNGRFISVVDSMNGGTYTDLIPWHDSYEYRKNKFNISYVDVPIELRFKTKSRFRLYAGFKAGYVVSHKTKRVDSEGKYKNYNTPNILPYRYGVYAKLGKGRLNANAYYGLTGIFEEGKGVPLHTATFGLSWFLF